MTPTQEYTDRYKHIEKEADERGRLIGVGRLRLSQILKLTEMYPGLEGQSEIINKDDGSKSYMDKMTMPLLAASVREIDGVKYPFPRSRQELDALIDNLDTDGMVAIVRATGRFLVPAAETVDDGMA